MYHLSNHGSRVYQRRYRVGPAIASGKQVNKGNWCRFTYSAYKAAGIAVKVLPSLAVKVAAWGNIVANSMLQKYDDQKYA